METTRALRPSPSHPAAGKAGLARLLAIENHCPGLPEPGRSAVLIMKAVSWFLMLLPTTTFGVWLVYQHELVARPIGSLWLVSTILCLGWGIYIRRRHRVLACLCAAVGLLHVGLLVLPAFMRAKTRAGIESTQPNEQR